MRLILLTLLLTSTPLLALAPEALDPVPREDGPSRAELREELARLGEWLLMRLRDGRDTADDVGFDERLAAVMQELEYDSSTHDMIAVLAEVFEEHRPNAVPMLGLIRDPDSVEETWDRMRDLHVALEAFRSREQRYPTDDEGLGVLFATDDEVANSVLDAWQNEITYWPYGAGVYELRAAGPDGELGTSDDFFAGERGLNCEAPANEASGVVRGVKIAGHRVLGGEFRMLLVSYAKTLSWDPALTVTESTNLPAGTGVSVWTDETNHEWRAVTDAEGWIEFELDTATIESLVLAGVHSVVFRFGVDDSNAPTPGMRLGTEWSLDAIGASMERGWEHRLGLWEDLRSRVVPGESGDAVRAVIDTKYIEPIRERLRLQAVVAERSAEIQAAGGLDPQTPEERTECMRLQTELGRTLYSMSDFEGAAAAFGDAARHASNGDDLDELEQLIEWQIISQEAAQ